MTDIVDRQIVVLAPKERDRVEGAGVPKNIERRNLTLTFRDHPMLDTDAISGMRIGPAGDVAGGIDAFCAGFEVFIDSNAAIDRKSCLFGEFDGGTHASTDDEEIRFDARAVLERCAGAVDVGDGCAQVKDHAVGFMNFAHEAAQLCAQDALK